MNTRNKIESVLYLSHMKGNPTQHDLKEDPTIIDITNEYIKKQKSLGIDLTTQEFREESSIEDEGSDLQIQRDNSKLS